MLVVVLFKEVKCNISVKWCDEPVTGINLQPPAIKYPGVCRRVKGKKTDGVLKYYFTTATATTYLFPLTKLVNWCLDRTNQVTTL